MIFQFSGGREKIPQPNPTQKATCRVLFGFWEKNWILLFLATSKIFIGSCVTLTLDYICPWDWIGWLVGCNNYLVSKTHYNLAFQNNIESMPSVFLSISTSINKISIENHSLGKQRESCVFLTENMYNQTLT